MNNMITRKEILSKAFNDCLHEMYATAQPEADWDNLIEEYRTGKISKNDSIYDRHYLSMDEFLYIRDKYKEAYNIKSHWKEDIEVLEDYLTNGGNKDKYIEDYEDEHGRHPGYRSYEEVPPLKEQILAIMKDFDCSEVAANVGEQIYNKVMETIKSCKDYYKFDREENDFNIQTSLGPSPCVDMGIVKKWWKDNYNYDVEIEERNPKLFWYRDNGYTDEDLAEEFDSENWKEIVDKEWEEEKAEKERQHQERLAEFKKQMENEQNN